VTRSGSVSEPADFTAEGWPAHETSVKEKASAVLHPRLPTIATFLVTRVERTWFHRGLAFLNDFRLIRWHDRPMSLPLQGDCQRRARAVATLMHSTSFPN